MLDYAELVAGLDAHIGTLTFVARHGGGSVKSRKPILVYTDVRQLEL